MCVHTHCPGWTKVIGAQCDYYQLWNFLFEFGVSNPLVGSSFFTLQQCVFRRIVLDVQRSSVFSTMSNFETFPDWSSKCLKPLVGSLAFLHCSSVCSYALSWMGKHIGRWWTHVSGFALHGCKTFEVPTTEGRSTGESRVYFREAAEVLVRLTTNTRRRDWLHVTLHARIGASISSIACGVDGDKGDTCRRNYRLSPHVPYFVPHCKVPCQDHAPHTLQVRTQVVGRMLPSRCR